LDLKPKKDLKIKETFFILIDLKSDKSNGLWYFLEIVVKNA
jgi:hypothetical protein